MIEQYKELGIKDLSDKCYEGDRHELLNEPDKDVVMKDVFEWISSRL